MSITRDKDGLRFQPSGGARGPAIPVGKRQRLTIERLVHDGQGTAHKAEMIWFVSGGLPGEKPKAQVLDAQSKVVDVYNKRLLSSSDLRRREPCTVAGRYGGCTLQHLEHGEQLALKQCTLQEQLQRFAGIEPEEWTVSLVGSEFGYRRRARIAVRWDARVRHLDVGFRAAASQEIVTFDERLVLVPSLQTVARTLPVLLQDFHRLESIDHMELFRGTASALSLRHTATLVDGDRQHLAAFCSARQAQL